MVLPFKSMSEMDEQNRQFFEEFNRAPNPFVNSTYIAKQNVNPYLQGILNTTQAANMFTDDAGLEEESYEEFPETGTVRSGLRSLFDNIKNSKVANLALSAINPIFGVASGIASIFNRPGFQDFRRSDTLADFFQARRDRKAREEAAKRGADKQRINDLRNFNQNFKSYFSGDGGGNTGGGNKGGGTFGDSVNDTGSFSDYS